MSDITIERAFRYMANKSEAANLIRSHINHRKVVLLKGKRKPNKEKRDRLSELEEIEFILNRWGV